jgi:hypothetical protein
MRKCKLIRHEHATPQHQDFSSEDVVGQAARRIKIKRISLTIFVPRLGRQHVTEQTVTAKRLLHIVLSLFFIEFAFLFSCGILILLVL